MKKLSLVTMGFVLLLVCSLAFGFSWDITPLTPADSTLGENMKLSRHKAVVDEVRSHIDDPAFTTISTGHDKCTASSIVRRTTYTYTCVSTNKWHRASNGVAF